MAKESGTVCDNIAGYFELAVCACLKSIEKTRKLVEYPSSWFNLNMFGPDDSSDEDVKAPPPRIRTWAVPAARKRVISSSDEESIEDADSTRDSNSNRGDLSCKQKSSSTHHVPAAIKTPIARDSTISSSEDVSSSDEEDESSSDDDGVRNVATSKKPSSPAPLEFPLSKLCFIFEKMGQQPVSADLIAHGSRLVTANSDKIQRAQQSTVAGLAAVMLRKEILEAAMLAPAVFKNLRDILVIFADAPDFLFPVEVYHYLLEEHDIGSHQDYPALSQMLKMFSILKTPAASTTSASSSTLSQAAGDGDEQTNRRLTLMTMVYALLELWPGSLPLGTALFKTILCRKPGGNPEGQTAQHDTQVEKRATVFSAVNLVLRVCAGDANNGMINVSLATRLVGNLVNVSESATRQALTVEISHLVAFYSKSMSTTEKKNTHMSSRSFLPGQVQAFLTNLTALTHAKKTNLDVVSILSGVLNDHLAAHDKQAPKLGLPALQLCFTLAPPEAAVGIAAEVMHGSTNSHLRAATLLSLVDSWATKVRAGSQDEGFDTSAVDGVEAGASAATSKATLGALWDLVLSFMAQDPVEKVRMGCLDALQTIATQLAYRESALDRREKAVAAATAQTEAATQLPSLGGKSSATTITAATTTTAAVTNPSILRTLPGKVLIAILVRCGDTSSKVQARAVDLLMLEDDHDDCTVIESGSIKNNIDCSNSEKDTTAITTTSSSSSSSSSSNIASTDTGSDMATAECSVLPGPSPRPSFLVTLDQLQYSARVRSDVSEVLLGLEVASTNVEATHETKKGGTGSLNSEAMRRLRPLFCNAELDYSPRMATPQQKSHQPSHQAPWGPSGNAQEKQQQQQQQQQQSYQTFPLPRQLPLHLLEEGDDDTGEEFSQRRRATADSTYNSIMFD